jgi:hypothetical protein
MVATRQARSAARASAARAARLFESLDLGVLSVVASFGTTEALARLGGVKESVCFPFEYDGPAFAGRCECCCPPSLTSPVFRKIPVTPKPDDVHPATWYRDY